MMHERAPASASPAIELEGVRVHNLQNVSLRLPLYKLIVISGVSGSGKSSLAFDTLYAEGQRRYIESFSAYARQFLDRLERPDADRIEHIPPAIAIRQHPPGARGKSTVATATEVYDHLRLLFAKIGRIVCPTCGAAIERHSPLHAFEVIERFDPGTRFQIAFPVNSEIERNDDPANKDEHAAETLFPERAEPGWASALVESGFVRAILDGRTIDLRDPTGLPTSGSADVWAVVDRLTAGKTADERVIDSLEQAFRHGDDRCIVLEEIAESPKFDLEGNASGKKVAVDGWSWRAHRFNARLVCDACRREFTAAEPALFSFNTPLGACRTCRGFGSVPIVSFDRVVPDPMKSLREGAIATWTTPAYRHELDELLDLAGDYGIPADVPFAQLDDRQRELIMNGVPERRFGGLNGFFTWLERHKYKLSVRVFMNRWRAYDVCPDCRGDLLQPMALAFRVDGRNIAELHRQTVTDAAAWYARLPKRLTSDELSIATTATGEIRSRLRYLEEAGLGYLTLDRAMNSLSGGESRRVALTSALGSNLVNTLYVLDEPSAGLHPRDSRRVIGCIEKLRDAHNTVVVVEHEEAFVTAADELVDIGPGAGREGGRVVYHGPPHEANSAAESITGAYLSGRKSLPPPTAEARRPARGWLALKRASGHNLKDLTVSFPLGVLCVVTGVSGSGKSTLVDDTLYPALCRALRQPCQTRQPGSFESLAGVDQIDAVVLVDESPIGRTPRSNPITYMKAFDDIRQVFAKTSDARLRNLTATHFSFNAKEGGRCPRCLGAGSIQIDMQFLADVTMTCPECDGRRYRREILEVTYRGMTISDVLNMTVRDAFVFFRGQPRLQRRLKFLKDVGLEYLALGQPSTALSGGESQRLKLAAWLAAGSGSRTLFLIDEPTTGLHVADVARLLDCFSGLIGVGHSMIVVEHNLHVIAAADYVIDLGPEAGEAGGRMVSCGTPEEIASSPPSVTGRFLREHGVVGR